MDSKETKYKLKDPRRERKRRKAKLWHRMVEGVQKIINKPLKSVPLILIAIVFVVTLGIAENQIIIDDYGNAEVSRENAATIIYAVLFLILLVLLFILTLSRIGRPKNAKEIDDDVESALDIKKSQQYKRPFLISAIPIENTDMIDYSFHARWVSIEAFEDAESNILTALGCQRVEGYRHGGRKEEKLRIKIIRAGKNKVPPDKGVLYGDL